MLQKLVINCNLFEVFKVFFKKIFNNKLVKDFIPMFGVDFLLKVSSFILLPFYLAYMSQDEFGLYSYMFVMVSSTTLFLSLGFHVSQMKLFHSFQKLRKKILSFYNKYISVIYISYFILYDILFQLIIF